MTQKRNDFIFSILHLNLLKTLNYGNNDYGNKCLSGIKTTA
ncbi:hypothetical protein M083_4059 [Bacteroides fragilis str. 3986 T(B)9]|nr:hypothetical protein M111_4288 [Bacteroides fragilis str. 3986T(B)10]EXY68310.1 hypothetical protein M083_4059 [Bacteroides fragilis str. 3986 T(B)9]EYA54040.1 hypothetical protein M114_0722 [Bacteroides fragilis str. 3986 N(B)22]